MLSRTEFYFGCVLKIVIQKKIIALQVYTSISGVFVNICTSTVTIARQKKGFCMDWKTSVWQHGQASV